VNFSITPGAPVPGGKDLPLLFLLNGGNVEAEQYSEVRSLASDPIISDLHWGNHGH
jgi:hypothetical protein